MKNQSPIEFPAPMKASRRECWLDETRLAKCLDRKSGIPVSGATATPITTGTQALQSSSAYSYAMNRSRSISWLFYREKPKDCWSFRSRSAGEDSASRSIRWITSYFWGVTLFLVIRRFPNLSVFALKSLISIVVEVVSSIIAGPVISTLVGNKFLEYTGILCRPSIRPK